MGEWMRGSRGDCDRFAVTLALLDDLASSAIDPAERAAALEHLASCARCQADQAADARLDAALRRAFSPPAVAPLGTRDLLLAIGATHEPAAHMTVTPARGAASPIRSVVNLGDFEDDFEGGFGRMSESDEGAGADRATSQAAPTSETGQRADQPTPARKLAAIPSLRPTSRRPGQFGRPSSQALAMGFSATAAAVILIVVAATLFASRGRAPASGSAPHRASATATASWRAAASSLGPIYAIAMDSPTDGWAIGDATPQNMNGGQQQTAAAFYHYDGSQWRLSQTVQGFFAAGGVTFGKLVMFSSTDGWAVDGSANTVLHYDGISWLAASITPASGAQIARLLAVDMVSPTQGWAAALLSGDSPHPPLRFLRFDGSQWSVEPGSISLPGVDMNTAAITGISALPDGDAWAIGGATPFLTPNTSTSSQVGFIVHRVSGVWQLASELNQPYAPESAFPDNILMTSATSGWIVGTRQSVKSSSNGDIGVSHALVLHYDASQTGSRWVPVNLPIANPTGSDEISSLTASRPNDVWIAGPSGSMTVVASGEVSAMLFHYDGAKWAQEPVAISGVTGFNQASIFAINETPDGTLWGVGGLFKEQNGQDAQSPLIASYHNGVWNVAAIATK